MSFKLSYGREFIMDGNMNPDTEVGTFADAHTHKKNPYKGMQVNALKIRNLSRPSDNVL